jgi:SNW domain-containing protein 1
MGKENKESESNALALQLTSDGKVKYDVIARQGHRKDKVIYSKLSDMLPTEVINEDDPLLQKPNSEEVAEITDKTRAALEKITSSKVSAALPVRAADKLVNISLFIIIVFYLFNLFSYSRLLFNGFDILLQNKEKNIILVQSNVL